MSYQLQSRCVRGEDVVIKNYPLEDARTPEEALHAAQRRFAFIYGSPAWFAGTVYEIQSVEIVRVGPQKDLNP